MIIVEMKKHFQQRAIEWWSAGTMTSWGFMVLSFPTMFRDNPAAHSLIEYAPQHIWGLAAMIAGSVRLCALFVNGLWYRTPAVRWLCSMVSIFIWFCIAAAFTMSPVVNMGIAIYAWHMIADMYSAMRSASDYIEAETQNRLRQMAKPPSFETRGDNVRSIASR